MKKNYRFIIYNSDLEAKKYVNVSATRLDYALALLEKEIGLESWKIFPNYLVNGKVKKGLDVELSNDYERAPMYNTFGTVDLGFDDEPETRPENVISYDIF